MNNYKLIIQYDGTNYAGWQIQENAVTVQEKITEAIQIITKEKINLIGSGRTDSGVHALGQTANFQTEEELDEFKFVHSLNGILPKEISVIEFEKVDSDFHARFSAKKRSYIYLISHKKSPFYFDYSMNYPELDTGQIKRLNSLSKSLIGEHDFTSFSKKNSEVENRICNITDLHWRKTGMFTVCYVGANRFLHGMVRALVGTLLHAEKNNLDEQYFKKVFEQKNREAAAESVAAKGLFLYKVRY